MTHTAVDGLPGCGWDTTTAGDRPANRHGTSLCAWLSTHMKSRLVCLCVCASASMCGVWSGRVRMLPFTNRMPLCGRDRAQVVTQKVKGESPAGRSGFLCLHFYSCCLLTSGSLSGVLRWWLPPCRASSDSCAFLSPCSWNGHIRGPCGQRS